MYRATLFRPEICKCDENIRFKLDNFIIKYRGKPLEHDALSDTKVLRSLILEDPFEAGKYLTECFNYINYLFIISMLYLNVIVNQMKTFIGTPLICHLEGLASHQFYGTLMTSQLEATCIISRDGGTGFVR